MSEAAFSARNSPWRVVLLVFLSFGFIFLGAWIAGLFGEAPRAGAEWIGWLSIAFFGACGAAWLRRIFDSAEVVRISERGIYSRRWSEDTIPWSEIADLTVWEYQRQKMIVLHLVHPDLFPSRTLLGRMAAANRALTGGDIPITLTGTDRSFDEAVAAVEHFGSSKSG